MIFEAASSLCMVQGTVVKGKKFDITLRFCQVNMFGIIGEPMEELIDKTLFAFVVTRDCSNTTLNVNSKSHKLDNLYSSKLSFAETPTIINVKDIYPCPLAVVPNNDVDEVLVLLLQRNRQKLLDNNTIKLRKHTN